MNRLGPLVTIALCFAGCGDSRARGPFADSSVDTGVDAVVDTGPGDAEVDTSVATDASTDADAATGSADPSAAGPYPVTTTAATATASGRSVPLVAHVPTRETRAPLAVFHPGFLTSSDAYVSLANRVASHGIIVVRADPPSNGSLFSSNHLEAAEDLGSAIDWALVELAPNVDAGRIATFGHSLGGKVAVMVARDDARVRAALGFDPINGGAGPLGYDPAHPNIVPSAVAALTIPLGFAGETNDTGGFMPCAPADQNFTTFYAAATSAPWAAQWTFSNANHMDFATDPSACGTPCSTCPQSASAGAVASAAQTIAAAFLLRHLEGRTEMEPWLTGAMVPADVTVASR